MMSIKLIYAIIIHNKPYVVTMTPTATKEESKHINAIQGKDLVYTIDRVVAMVNHPMLI